MNYNGTIYRPPVEAGTLLIPITEGCTHNSCSFCNMYQDVPFRIWQLDEIEKYMKDITEMEKLEEIYEFVRCLTNDTIFMNEHASNLFHVQCRIPDQKEELQFIDESDEKELREYRKKITRAF